MKEKMFIHYDKEGDFLEIRFGKPEPPYYEDLVKLNYTSNSLKRALAHVRAHRVGFWDALLAATMEEGRTYAIYTEDANFSKIRGIKAINPFK